MTFKFNPFLSSLDVVLPGKTGTISGTVSPNIAPGVVANVGQLYINTSTSDVWVKSGAGDTEWTLVATSGSDITSINGDTTAAQLLVTGATGTNFGISTAAGTHTFNLPIASGINTGKLSNTDWSTFNNKQDALNISDLTEDTSSVLTITNGINSIIGASDLTIQVTEASGGVSGYLSGTDWSTFNGKQDLLVTGTAAQYFKGDLTLGTLLVDVDHNAITNTHNLTTDIDHDQLTNYAVNEHIDHTLVTLTAGEGISGGGDISSNRSFALDINGLSNSSSTLGASDLFAFYDASTDLRVEKITFSNINTQLDHNSLINTHNLTTDIDHGSISGLTGSDDHSQYLLLAGRSGGQIGYGGTGSGDDLKLISTSHGTKGYVEIEGGILLHDYDESSSVIAWANCTLNNNSGNYKLAINAANNRDSMINFCEAGSNRWQIYNDGNGGGDTFYLLSASGGAVFSANYTTSDLTISKKLVVSDSITAKTSVIIEDPGAGTNSVTLKAGVVSGSYDITLPLAQGSANDILQNDGSGNLSWVANDGGITTLNTLTALTQTLATGSTGTEPNWASATSTHTLHIPLASGVGVISGTITKTEYDTFDGKQDALVNPVTGTGTNNQISKFTSTGSTIGDSIIADTGTVTINSSAATAPLSLQINSTVVGAISSAGVWQIGQSGETSSHSVLGGLTATHAIKSETSLILEDPGAGTETWTIQSPTLAGSYTLTLPEDDGEANEVLKTNGSGVTSWVDPSDLPIDIGMSVERPDSTIVNTAGTLYLELEALGTGDINYYFASGITTLDCTTGAGTGGKARVALTAGADASNPQLNYIYVVDGGGGVATLTAGTTLPTGEFGWVARASVPDATTWSTTGAYVHQRYSDSLLVDSRGAFTNEREKIRAIGATYESGMAQTLTITVNGGSADNVILTTTAGIAYQLHRQTFPAFSGTPTIYVANHPTTPYLAITDLNAVLVDANNDTLSARRFNFVIWGSVNKTTGECKLFLNLPNGSYSTNDQALADSDNTAVTTIPSDFKQTGFLIGRLPLRHRTQDNGTWLNLFGGTAVDDLRGTPVGTRSVGSSAGTEFDDSLFKVYNTADSTKLIQLDASNITTGTTRTYSGVDADGWIGVLSKAGTVLSPSVAGDDLDMGTGGVIANDVEIDTTLNINGASTGSSTFQAPANGDAIVYTLPANDGDADQSLVTDGAGVLSWENNQIASAGDIKETSFAAANNQSSPTSVTGLAFANGTVRSFEALVSTYIDATADLFEVFTLRGIQRGADWQMSITSTGDESGIDFTINSSGQVLYSSTNVSGFSSNAIKFRAITTSV